MAVEGLGGPLPPLAAHPEKHLSLKGGLGEEGGGGDGGGGGGGVGVGWGGVGG